MAAYGSDLYVAGEFTVIGGQARPGLALVDPITVTTLPFALASTSTATVLSAVEAQVSGSTVTVTWTAVPGADGDQLEAGSGPLLSNAAVVPTAATSLVAPGVPAGTYYVRVHAIGASGLRSTSGELVVKVP